MGLSASKFLGIPSPHLLAFLRHAAQHSPYYSQFEWARNLLVGLPIRLNDIPITKKSDVQNSPELFRSKFDPPAAGAVVEKHTSGSTGHALQIFKSQMHFAINAMENERLLKAWHLEANTPQLFYCQPNDANPMGTVKAHQLKNGNVVHELHTRSADDIKRLLLKTRATLLAARPSQVSAILDGTEDFSFLKIIKTTTEAVTDHLRSQISALPSCQVVDLYGAVETGLIAVSCPTCGKYHLAEHNIIIEVLRDDDTPAAAGELGRVVATVFNNSAMPLIRYDLGDMVHYSLVSPCQPGKMSFDKIFGRERMMFRLPSGERILPALDPAAILELGIKRFKLVQISDTCIEFQYMGFDPDLRLEHDIVQQLIAREISPEFLVSLRAVNDFPLAPSGKYLMHERLIA